MVQKRLDDITYVHYNLRLRERLSKSSNVNYISLDNILLERLLADWVIGTEKTAMQEDEVNHFCLLICLNMLFHV